MTWSGTSGMNTAGSRYTELWMNVKVNIYRNNVKIFKVHGDVFRPAASPLLFSALVGTGSQLAVVVLLVILFAILGELYTERGSLLSTSIFMYAATAPLNGYFGGSLYARSA